MIDEQEEFWKDNKLVVLPFHHTEYMNTSRGPSAKPKEEVIEWLKNYGLSESEPVMSEYHIWISWPQTWDGEVLEIVFHKSMKHIAVLFEDVWCK